MPDHQPAIDPDVGSIVDRAEMEHELPATVGRRDLYRAPVPDHRVIPGIGDAAGPRLRWEGDDHRPIERVGSLEPALIQPDIGIVIGESPGSAEIDPAVTGQLRTRMKVATVHQCCLHGLSAVSYQLSAISYQSIVVLTDSPTSRLTSDFRLPTPDSV